jgi:exopolyphosphatase/guanosine-5'-triphosphate,3'-diphosphate pyrophosphatase
MDRAIACIRKFRLRADTYGAQELLAVATSAVREATNRHEFLARVADEAGVHVELLSGVEEARLIALAVSVEQRARVKQRALIIDIGGGSTELAVTRNGEPAALMSLKLGAVRLTEQFITSDPISDKQLRRLRSELREVITPRAPEIQAVGFDVCYGTSGTITALSSMMMRRRLEAAHGRPGHPQIEAPLRLDDLSALNRELAALPVGERGKIPGLNPARAEIIVAGGQLLEAILESVGVTELTACNWALREGIIIAQLARRAAPLATLLSSLERDPSLRGTMALAERYQADLKHARRVAHLSQQLFDALRPLHLLGGEHRRLLTAAALLHDIGYFISHTSHNKHSGYLIQHSELIGFTASEVALIANVARYHRTSLPKAKHPYYAALPPGDREIVRKLAALLRIADALDHDHAGRVRNLSCEISDTAVHLTIHCSRENDTLRWRVEERSNLFAEVFGRRIELMAEFALGAPPKPEAMLK